MKKETDLQIVGEAANSAEALEFLSSHECDFMILDINMPGGSGLHSITEFKKLKPYVKILVLSIYPEKSFAVTALEMGASGYLTKDSSPGELIKAIRKINTGKIYISESLANTLAERIHSGSDKILHEKLSIREMEILLLIGEGKTTNEIAMQLYISQNTVSTYRSRILKKMNMRTNSALIHYVVKNNLLDIPQ